MEFRSLDLPEVVMRGIDAVGFTTCTPIQEQTLPDALSGRDIAGQAQTGTGKMAAFLSATFTRLLENESPGRGPRAFVNTRREADWLAQRLQANGVDASALTGDVNQRVRLRILTDFKEGKLQMLVATGVASRGLHIDGVTHVYNYDVPQDPEDYVHRIGRTARAGASGTAITLGCESWATGLEAIEKLIGFKLPVEHVTDEMLAEAIVPKLKPRLRDGGRPRGSGGPGRGGPGGSGSDKNRSRRRPSSGAKQAARSD